MLLLSASETRMAPRFLCFFALILRPCNCVRRVLEEWNGTELEETRSEALERKMDGGGGGGGDNEVVEQLRSLV